MAHSLTDRYDDRIAGVLSCYDRLLITGTVPVICYAEGMTRFLYANGIRIFDYPQFAQTLQNPRVNIAGIRRADLLPTCKCSRQPGCRGNCADCWTPRRCTSKEPVP